MCSFTDVESEIPLKSPLIGKFLTIGIGKLLVKVNYKTLLFSKNLELALNRQDFGIPTGPMMLYNQNGIEYKSLHTPIMIEQESQTTDEE